jgi:pimeloyl-ACP methyl ester carboxylesterase
MSLPELSTVATPSGTIAWREAGDGAPLVLLHGLGSSSKSWADQYEGLAAGRRVIAWDCPGYGGSDDPAVPAPSVADYVEALTHLLDALALSDVDLLGHSMGGAHGGRFAALWPHRVRRLILSATKSKFGGPGRDGSAYLARLEELKRLGAERFGAARAAGMLGPDPGPAILERTRSIASEVRPSGYGPACHMLSDCDNTEPLRSLAMPTLILCGSADRVAPLAESERIAALVPGSRLEVIDGAGHVPYGERPEAYNAAIVRFLT